MCGFVHRNNPVIFIKRRENRKKTQWRLRCVGEGRKWERRWSLLRSCVDTEGGLKVLIS